jgi:hypothetical protein
LDGLVVLPAFIDDDTPNSLKINGVLIKIVGSLFRKDAQRWAKSVGVVDEIENLVQILVTNSSSSYDLHAMIV